MANKHNKAKKPRTFGRRRTDNRGSWLRKSIVAGGLIGWFFVLVGYSVWCGPDAWRHWMPKMSFSKDGLSRNGQSTNRQRDSSTNPSYLGEGRAELGDFSIRVFNPVTHTTLRTDFRLEGKTSCRNKNSFDQFMKNNQRFFREQVAVTMRDCKSEELTDPNFSLLGKKLVSRVNRALGKKFLKSVAFNDFTLHEAVGASCFVEYDLPSDDTNPSN